MTKRLTDLAVRKMKPGPVRREVPDPGCRGLYCVVQPSGYRSFVVRFRFNGDPKKLSLGAIPLGQARKEAAAALHEVDQGRDPTEAKRQAKAERRIVQANTFRVVAEKYFALVAGRRDADGNVTFNGSIRTAARQWRDLERAIFPTLGHRPVVDIKRSEIVELLDQIDIASGPTAADRALAIIRRVLNWHATRADSFVPPIVKGMARTKTKERSRDRTLSDGEIGAIWKSEQPGAFPALVKFLLLSGARRAEAARMTWDEIEGGNWNLPASRNKTKSPLTRPLSASALAILESQRPEGRSFIFSNDGRTPISTFSRDKVAFDKATGTSDWRIHDLRRTARSLLSRADVDADTSERCLGHALPTIRATYDRHSYLPQMQRAYDALSALISRIANPPDGKVLELRKRS